MEEALLEDLKTVRKRCIEIQNDLMAGKVTRKDRQINIKKLNENIQQLDSLAESITLAFKTKGKCDG